VLNQWLLSLFNVKRFEDLAEHLRHEALEGLDENNVHHFHHALTAQLFNLTQLPTELLLEYDQNIVRHTQRLNERDHARRGADRLEVLPVPDAAVHRDLSRPLLPRSPGPAGALNTQVAVYNADKPEADQITPWMTKAPKPGRSSTSWPTGWPPAAARRF
jgi:hypothetical protein